MVAGNKKLLLSSIVARLSPPRAVSRSTEALAGVE